MRRAERFHTIPRWEIQACVYFHPKYTKSRPPALGLANSSYSHTVHLSGMWEWTTILSQPGRRDTASQPRRKGAGLVGIQVGNENVLTHVQPVYYMWRFLNRDAALAKGRIMLALKPVWADLFKILNGLNVSSMTHFLHTIRVNSKGSQSPAKSSGLDQD